MTAASAWPEPPRGCQKASRFGDGAWSSGTAVAEGLLQVPSMEPCKLGSSQTPATRNRVTKAQGGGRRDGGWSTKDWWAALCELCCKYIAISYLRQAYHSGKASLRGKTICRPSLLL